MLSVVILLKNITFISKISLVLSFFISIVLVSGLIGVFFLETKEILSIKDIPTINNFGKTILVLFWAVVG